MGEIEKVWENVLEQLADEVSKVSYDSWIRPIRPIELTENTITLGVPSDINKEMVVGKYFSLIESGLFPLYSNSYLVVLEREQNG